MADQQIYQFENLNGGVSRLTIFKDSGVNHLSVELFMNCGAPHGRREWTQPMQFSPHTGNPINPDLSQIQERLKVAAQKFDNDVAEILSNSGFAVQL